MMENPAQRPMPEGDVTMSGGDDDNRAGNGNLGVTNTLPASSKATLTYPPQRSNASAYNSTNTTQSETTSSPASSTGQSASNPRETVRAPHAVIDLHELCQKRGLEMPEFVHDEDMPQRFNARLKLAGREIVLTIDDDNGYADLAGTEEGKKKEQRFFSSKKAAREAAAAKGLEILNATPHETPLREKERDDVNWVGKLMEFYQKHPQIPQQQGSTSSSSSSGGMQLTGPIFIEGFKSNPKTGAVERHECQCKIPHRPDQAFGRNGEQPRYFSTKKAAKTNAAKEAYAWLKDQDIIS